MAEVLRDLNQTLDLIHYPTNGLYITMETY